jgi:RNA polymerase sigma-70 factor (ECF subfamily)
MDTAKAGPTNDASPDSVLVERIAAGDHHSFEVLMRRYNQTLYRTARSILKDDAEAEDAVQDAYLLAYRSIASFRGDAKLITWLVRIVVNEAIARLRKRTRSAEIISLDGDIETHNETREDNMSRGDVELPEQAALRAETRRLLEAKIDKLPDSFRTVFVLRAMEEMTVEETAASLGIPEATVRTRYFRARGLLRESLMREIDFVFEDAFAFAGDRCDRIVAGVRARLVAATTE